VEALVDAPVRSSLFGPLLIEYDDRVLTPRAWTVGQSDWAVELLEHAEPGAILELCAGAGHIGVLAAVRSDRPLVQVEASAVAAGYARRNAARCGADVEVREGDLDVALHADERFPVILADPPYLRTSEVTSWPDDPCTAIDGGVDGLAIVRSCLRIASDHLPEHGCLLLQVADPAQADEVRALLDAQPGWGLVVTEARTYEGGGSVALVRRR